MLAEYQANLIVTRCRAKLTSAMADALMAEDDDRPRMEAVVEVCSFNLATDQRMLNDFDKSLRF